MFSNALSEVWLMGDHQFYLCLHHAYYLIDAVQFVLAANVLSIEEIGPPNIPEEVVADELLFEAFCKFFIGVRSEEVFPILSVLDLGKHACINDKNNDITNFKKDGYDKLFNAAS